MLSLFGLQATMLCSLLFLLIINQYACQHSDSNQPSSDVDLKSVLEVDHSNGFKVIGLASSTIFGREVSSVGDVNGDGVDDFVAMSASNGEVFVIYGTYGDSSNIDATSSFGGFTIATGLNNIGGTMYVSGAGDRNHDGLQDIAIGLPTVGDSGTVLIIFGSFTRTTAHIFMDSLTFEDGYVIYGFGEGSNCGVQVRSAGDTNNDTFADLIIGCNEANGLTGMAFVINGVYTGDNLFLSELGQEDGFRVVGRDQYSRFGSSVAGVGDVNGDGIDDIAITTFPTSTAYYHTTDNIAVCIIYGSLNPVDVYVGEMTPPQGIIYVGFHGPYTVSAAGDFNNDTFADVLLGARLASPFGRSAAGEAFVLYGTDNPVSNVMHLSSVEIDPALGIQLYGARAGEYFGNSVSGGADLNGDGCADVMVSAILANATGSDGLVRQSAGISYVIYGGSNAHSIDMRSFVSGSVGFRILGAGVGDRAGRGISAGGDFNHDGVPDIIVGAPQPGLVVGNSLVNMGPGVVYVLYGNRFYTAAPTSLPTFKPTLPPIVTVFQDVTLSSDAPGFVGTMDNEYIGGNMAAGDVNGDGVVDYILSTPNALSGDGAIYVVYGNATGLDQLSGLDLNSLTQNQGYYVSGEPHIGVSLSFLGDVNGDGVGDFAIGVYSTGEYAYVIYGTRAERVHVELPVDPLNGAIIRSASNGGAGGFGSVVSAAGDVNGDGLQDLMVSCPNEGYVAVVFGSPSLGQHGVVTEEGSLGFFVYGDSNGDVSFGSSTSPAGDLNGDGFDDIVITGENWASTSSVVGGVIFGHSNQTFFGMIDFTLPDPLEGGFKVMSSAEGPVVTSAAGDVNGDGYADLIIGSAGVAPLGRSFAGISFVLFGHSPSSLFPDVDLDAFVTGAATGFKIIGAHDNEWSGVTVRGAGDVNGDGVDDIAVGALFHSSDSMGCVYLIFGHAAGVPFQDIDLSTFYADTRGFRVLSPDTGSMFGSTIVALGDVNNDGTSDLLLGAPRATMNGVMSGRAYIVLGQIEPTPSASPTRAPTRSPTLAPSLLPVQTQYGDFPLSSIVPSTGIVFDGAAPGDELGLGVGSGDVNGDGLNDILLTSQNAFNGSGAVYVLLNQGHSGASFPVTNLHQNMSAQLGYVVIGAAREMLGASVSFVGDMNGDGVGDFIMGRKYTPGGTPVLAYVVFGKSGFARASFSTNTFSAVVGLRINGNGAASTVGYDVSVSGAGDVNGDGLSDVIVGATGLGAASVVFGSRSTLVSVSIINIAPSRGFRIMAPLFISGTMTPLAAFGISVSSAGDVNGDGFDDVLVGSTGPLDVQRLRGVVVFGRNSTTSPFPSVDFTSTGDAPATLSGFTVSGDMTRYMMSSAGDFNHDGFDDILIGVSFQSPTTLKLSAGVSFVIFGHNSSTPFSALDLSTFVNSAAGFRITGSTMFQLSGHCVAPVGDMNGDGIDDLTVSTFGGAGSFYVLFGHTTATPFPDIDLGNFYAYTRGFRIVSLDAVDLVGRSVSAGGDLNQDGIGDLIVGASGKTGLAGILSGRAYVIYGKSPTAAPTVAPTVRPSVAPTLPAITTVHKDVNLTSTVGLGVRGFRVSGTNTSQLGTSISHGDVNGDGVSDVLVSSVMASYANRTLCGTVTIVFGRRASAEPLGDVDLAVVSNGASGVAVLYGDALEKFGQSVSVVGDVNGDGFNDIAVGSPMKGPSIVGRVYVVYGSANWSDVDVTALTTNARGFDIRYATSATSYGGARLGWVVSGAGDMNNDGFDDIIVCAPWVRSNNMAAAGTCSIIFGSAGATNIDLAMPISGTMGFRVLGSDVGARLGYSASGLGDVNGDGFDDIIVSSWRTSVTSTTPVAYVLYGRAGSFEDIGSSTYLSSSQGFSLTGSFGQYRVAKGGDFNGDGHGDILISLAVPVTAMQAYVIFGQAGYTQSSLFLPAFQSSPSSGFRLTGASASSIDSAGDVNGDGYDDILVGSADLLSGVVYVLFGHRPETAFPDVDLSNFYLYTRGFRIVGSAGGLLGSVVSAAGDVNGDGLADVAVSVPLADTLGRRNNGATYVIYGTYETPTALPTALPSPTPSAAPSAMPTLPPVSTVFRDVNLTNSVLNERGVQISGGDQSQQLGNAGTYGDVNGDGISDVILTASVGNYAGRIRCGFAVVVYGRIDSTPDLTNIDVNAIDPTVGAFIYGQAGENIGVSVAVVGDMNGDRIADIAVGAPSADGDRGRVYIVYGRPSWQDVDLSTFSPTNTTSGYTIFGFAGEHGAGARFGGALSAAGDFNGDGLADLVVSANLYNQTTDPQSNGGRVSVVLSVRDPGEIHMSNVSSARALHLTSSLSLNRIGLTVSDLGDVNGDGFDDVAVGCFCPEVSSFVSTHVLFGRNATVYPELASGSLPVGTGYTISNSAVGQYRTSRAGDFNNDGFADFMMSSALGTILVVFGHNYSDPFPSWLMSSFQTSAETGFKISGTAIGLIPNSAGDLNGDGIDDIAVTSTTEYTAFVLFGHTRAAPFPDIRLDSTFTKQTRGFRVIGRPQTAFGVVLSSAGDFNSDGVADLLVTAYTANTFGQYRSGAAYVVFGMVESPTASPSARPTVVPTLKPTALPTLPPVTTVFADYPLSQLYDGAKPTGFAIFGASSASSIGRTVASGDVNGDSFPDILVSAPDANAGAGVVFVIFGRNESFPHENIDLANFTSAQGVIFSGSVSNSMVGTSVSIAGDVNQDGIVDILIACSNMNNGGGVAYVIYGSRTLQSRVLSDSAPPLPSEGFRILRPFNPDGSVLTQVQAAGDFNGDGYADVLVSSPGQMVAGDSVTGVTTLILGGFGIGDVNLAVPTASGRLNIFGDAATMSGSSLSSLDFNGDGLSDIAIGSVRSYVSAGECVGAVLFGFTTEDPLMDVNLNQTLSSAQGFRIMSTNIDTFTVKSAGDINDDGFDDLIVGSSSRASLPSRTGAGVSFVIFGHGASSAFVTIYLDSFLASSTLGFKVLGGAANDKAGADVGAAGDFNNDGYADFMIGGSQVQSRTTPVGPGVAYVIFGHSNTTAFGQIDLNQWSSTARGMCITGKEIGDSMPIFVRGVGDVNGDGISDVVVGAARANYQNRGYCGALYVVFGGQERPTAAPTRQPTRLPTAKPTSTPIPKPTAKPTISPTLGPSVNPTLGPSDAPTLMPTHMPVATASPTTRIPSAVPSRTPVVPPSVSPSVAPSTAQPSVVPSEEPTNYPISAAPTWAPAGEPTANPVTALPTWLPSAAPTVAPSREATAGPTSSPSAKPTPGVTENATAEPTVNDTASSSSMPTGATTRSPTVMLSQGSNSSAPSVSPTEAPTVEPSAADTVSASSLPSSHPTRIGTSAPTVGVTPGSDAPVVLPISLPTSSPSEASSAFTPPTPVAPEVQPSLQPTGAWTRAPSVVATEEASTHPTEVSPSSQPSLGPTLALTTATPTAGPSVVASKSPQADPTHAPTPVANGVPISNFPTASPSDGEPVGNVTHIPSADPTRQPSTASNAPTVASVIVTDMPSLSPTIVTAAPTRLPSVQPSAGISLITVRAASSSVKTGVVSPGFVSLSVVARPTESVTLHVALYKRGDSAVETAGPLVPDTFTFSALPASGNAVFSSALPALSVGEYFYNVTVSGPSALQYAVSYASPTTELSVVSASSPLPAPVLLSAIFADDGSSVAIAFDINTNKGGVSTQFACSQLFSFTCAEKSTCVWSSASQVSAYISTVAGCAAVDAQVSLVSTAVIKAECAGCDSSTWPSTLTNTIIVIQSPTTAVAPVVVISAPDAIGECDSLALDMSSSSGTGGRAWASRSVQVSSLATAEATSIQQFLSSVGAASSPAVVPLSYFAKGFTYTFAVTQCNFLGQCGQATKTVVAVSSTIPTVTLPGAALRTVKRSAALSVSSDAFFMPCNGAASRAGLTYAWALSVDDVQDLTLTSASKDHSKLLIPANSLSVGTTYGVTLTVAIASTQQSASAKVQVFVTSGAVVPVISQGLSRSVRVDGSVVVDASGSFDEDQVGLTGADAGLKYAWSCAQVSPVFTNDCAGVLSVSSSSGTNFTAKALSSAAGAVVQVTLTLLDAAQIRSAQSVVTITVLPSLSPPVSVSSNVAASGVLNSNRELQLVASVSFPRGYNGSATWSVDDTSAFSLATAARSPLVSAIGSAGVTQSIYLVIAANTLPDRSTLTFALTARLFSAEGTASVASVPVTVNAPPMLGSFTVSPRNGTEIVDHFTFLASQWVDSDLPLQYLFAYVSPSGAEVTLRSKMETAYTSLVLTAGLKAGGYTVGCVLKVFDSLSAVSSLTDTVAVYPQTTPRSTSELASLVRASLKSGADSVDGKKQSAALGSYLVNQVDCSAAPDCGALNRKSCYRTQNTCGTCVSNAYVGTAGDSNSLCVLSTSVSARNVGSTCSSDAACGAFETCSSTSLCTRSLMQCKNNCTSPQGTCKYVDINSGEPVRVCYVGDTDCAAQCECSADFIGSETCGLNSTQLLEKQDLRWQLLQSVQELVALEDADLDTVEGWINTLLQVAQVPDELSDEAAKVLLSIADSIIAAAEEVGVSVDTITSLLGAVDAVVQAGVDRSVRRRRMLRAAGSTDEAHRLLSVSTDQDSSLAQSEVTVAAFRAYLESSLVPGQDAVELVLPQLRVFSQVVAVSDESNSVISASVPLTALESANSQAASTISVPTSTGQTSLRVSLSSVRSEPYNTNLGLSEYGQLFSNPLTVDLGGSSCVGEQCRFEMTLQTSAALSAAADLRPVAETHNTTCTAGKVETSQVNCSDGTVIPVTCDGKAAYTVVSACPVITYSPACNALAGSGVSASGCRVVSRTETSITCSCPLSTDDSGRRLQGAGAEDDDAEKSVSVSYVGMLSQVKSNFVNTIVSAQGLNASTLEKGWSAMATVGSLALAIIFAFYWSHQADANADKIVPKSDKMKQLAVANSAKEKEKEKDNKTEGRRSRIMPMKRGANIVVNRDVQIAEQALPTILSSQSLSNRVTAEVKQHHKWFGIVFHFSRSFPRVLRVASLATNVIIMLFIQSLTYALTNGDDGTCETYNTPEACVEPRSAYATGSSKCYWSETNSECAFVEPDSDIKVILFVAIFSALVCTPFALLVDYIIIYVLSAPTKISSTSYAAARLASRHRQRTGSTEFVDTTSPDASRARTVSGDIYEMTNTLMMGSSRRRTRTESHDMHDYNNRRLRTVSSGSELFEIIPGQVNTQQSTVTHRDHRDSNVSQRDSMFGSFVVHRERGNSTIDTGAQLSAQSDLRDLVEDISNYRLTLSDQERAEFDLLWGLDENGFFKTDDELHAGFLQRVKKTFSFGSQVNAASNGSVSQRVLLDLRTVHETLNKEEAFAVERKFDNRQKGRRLLFLFQRDLLPGVSGMILESKGQRDNISTPQVSREAKIAAWTFLTLANVGMLFYILLFAFSQTTHRQGAWAMSFALWLVVEILLVSSATVVFTHILVPSLIMQDVKKIKMKLVESIRAFNHNVKNRTIFDDDADVGENGGSNGANFNAANYLFTSTRLAKKWHELREAQIIAQFRTPWPKQSYMRESNVSKSYSKKYTALTRSASIVAIFFFTQLLQIPPGLQDMVVQMVATASIGYTVLLHVDLYHIFPLLVCLPLLLIIVVVHFILQSGKGSALEELNRMAPPPTPKKAAGSAKLESIAPVGELQVSEKEQRASRQTIWQHVNGSFDVVDEDAGEQMVAAEDLPSDSLSDQNEGDLHMPATPGGSPVTLTQAKGHVNRKQSVFMGIKVLRALESEVDSNAEEKHGPSNASYSSHSDHVAVALPVSSGKSTARPVSRLTRIPAPSSDDDSVDFSEDETDFSANGPHAHRSGTAAPASATMSPLNDSDSEGDEGGENEGSHLEESEEEQSEEEEEEEEGSEEDEMEAEQDEFDGDSEEDNGSDSEHCYTATGEDDYAAKAGLSDSEPMHGHHGVALVPQPEEEGNDFDSVSTCSTEM